MRFNHAPVVPIRITSLYGPRNTGIQGASTFHRGIDLGANKSLSKTEIYAVKRGAVSANYYNKVRGWVVVIKHDDTYSTLYQHLAQQSPCKVGDVVLAGDVIGIMGNTSTTLKIATHLHMELLEHGAPVNFRAQLDNIVEVKDDMTEREYLNTLVNEAIDKRFKDSAAPSTWAKEAIDNLKAKGLTDGSRPKAPMTREEGFVLINRVMK